MPAHEWTTQAQKEYLSSMLPSFKAAREGAKDKSLSRFWVTLEEGWFQRFPQESALGLPPRIPGAEPLTEDQLTRLGAATAQTKERLRTSSWMRYRSQTRNAPTGKSTRTPSALFKLLKKKTVTRPYRPLEVYQKLHRAKVKKEVMRRGYGDLNEEAERAAASSAEAGEGPEVTVLTEEETAALEAREEAIALARIQKNRRLRMSMWRLTSTEMYAAESEEVKTDVRAAMEELNRRRDEVDETEHTPEQYQHAIDQLGHVVGHVTETIKDATGWHGVLMLGGPMPRRGGAISTKTFCFGTTPLGSDFIASHPNFDDVKTHFNKFLKRSFPHDVRDARGFAVTDAPEAGAETHDASADELQNLISLDPEDEDDSATPKQISSVPKRVRRKPTAPAAQRTSVPIALTEVSPAVPTASPAAAEPTASGPAPAVPADPPAVPTASPAAAAPTASGPAPAVPADPSVTLPFGFDDTMNDILDTAFGSSTIQYYPPTFDSFGEDLQPLTDFGEDLHPLPDSDGRSPRRVETEDGDLQSPANHFAPSPLFQAFVKPPVALPSPHRTTSSPPRAPLLRRPSALTVFRSVVANATASIEQQRVTMPAFATPPVVSEIGAAAIPQYVQSRPMANPPKGHPQAAKPAKAGQRKQKSQGKRKVPAGHDDTAPLLAPDESSAPPMTQAAAAESARIRRDERRMRKERAKPQYQPGSDGEVVAAAAADAVVVVARPKRASKAFFNPDGTDVIRPVKSKRGDLSGGARMDRGIDLDTAQAEEDADLLSKLTRGKAAAPAPEKSATRRAVAAPAKRKAAAPAPEKSRPTK
ncbi:hypothetical protein GGX14DRAFT_404737 [Mycena pura]|uniref:Uncharacterized protein n=1 Tax=Mycena pura TaxID=153505 RepID=A0AAD6UTF9_9AGAR|nr:hypothetical protein GGX14DRAFT_404737 [Mycena pura]